MLSLGWSEMLIIAVVVLIFVGPKDLPMMMRNVGRAMGMMRRMSNEFRREIEKAVSADEMRDMKKSLSDPLRQTRSELNREFNQIRNGKVEPTGALKPSKEGEESVYDEIRARAGMGDAAAGDAETVKAAAGGSESTSGPVKAAPRFGAGTKANGATPPTAKATPEGEPASEPAPKAAKPRKSTAKKSGQSTKAGSTGKETGATAKKATAGKTTSGTGARAKSASTTSGAKKATPKKTGSAGKGAARKTAGAPSGQSGKSEAPQEAAPQTRAQDKPQ